MKKVKGLFILIIVMISIASVIVMIQFNRNTVVIEKDGTAEKITTLAIDGEKTIQLSAPAESEEEAKEIAEMYGITYIGYYRGYGQYETSEDVNTLKEYGLENNLPDLEVVYKALTK